MRRYIQWDAHCICADWKYLYILSTKTIKKDKTWAIVWWLNAKRKRKIIIIVIVEQKKEWKEKIKRFLFLTENSVKIPYLVIFSFDVNVDDDHDDKVFPVIIIRFIIVCSIFLLLIFFIYSASVIQQRRYFLYATKKKYAMKTRGLVCTF